MVDRPTAKNTMATAWHRHWVGFTIPFVRRVEWILLLFQVNLSIVATLMGVSPATQSRIGMLTCAVLAGYILLVLLDTLNPKRWGGVLRDWLPLGLVFVIRWEIGWLALGPQACGMEQYWVGLDRLLLRSGAKASIEACGSLLPSILEISYTSVQILAPFSVAMLYLYGRRHRVDRFLFIFVVAVLLCYTQLPLWPSESPRTLFPGEDLPAFDNSFRRFNLWILSNCGIHVNVFPSAHVAAALSCAFGMLRVLPERKWVSRVLLLAALLIAVAAVYGRYNYLVDVVAGATMAIIALGVSMLADGVLLAKRPSSARRIRG